MHLTTMKLYSGCYITLQLFAVILPILLATFVLTLRKDWSDISKMLEQAAQIGVKNDGRELHQFSDEHQLHRLLDNHSKSRAKN